MKVNFGVWTPLNKFDGKRFNGIAIEFNIFRKWQNVFRIWLHIKGTKK